MSNIMIKCKNCGAMMQADMEAKTITCLHCGTTHLLSEFLDTEDLNFISKASANDFARKLDFNDAIKHGETCLYRADYLKAEEYFKLAISINEENFKGYMGVVKAKTHNFNILPYNEDYKNYAKKALQLAGTDDYLFIKNELEKLDLLKEEKERLARENLKREQQKKSAEQSRAIKANFFSKLAYFLTGFLTIVLLVGIVVSVILKKDEEKGGVETIEISSVEQFLSFASSGKNLDSNIIFASDLDFEGKTISPIGGATPFTGTINGNGHTIKNLTVKQDIYSEELYIGLFNKTDGAKISGLTLENVLVSFESNQIVSTPPRFAYVGFFAGYAKDTTISNCAVEKTCALEIKNSNSSISTGSFAGYAESSQFSISYSDANISILEESNPSLEHFIGSLVGYVNDSTISNCYSTGTISAKINSTIKCDAYFGGIAGLSVLSTGTITNCFFAGKIESLDEIGTFKFEHFAAVTNQNKLYPIDENKIYLNCLKVSLDMFISSSNESLEKTDLEDYTESANHILFTENEEELLQFIEINFSENWWTDLETTTPKLKIFSKENTDDDASVLF